MRYSITGELQCHISDRVFECNHENVNDEEITAARQGLAVLRASAVVVLKHETSTHRQRHNLISIDFTFGLGDYVREITSPAKCGSDPMSDRGATWGQHIRVL